MSSAFLPSSLGWEAGFTLEKESQTLALVLRENLVLFAFDNRESLMRWQVRVTSQFEEGQHFLAHLIQLPNKSKLPTGQVRVHVQNRRFSLTHGVPPKLAHSWDLVDLRRYGCLDGGRFVYEGGSRCGKGEGVHVLRLDDANGLQNAFESACNGKLESKRKSTLVKQPISTSKYFVLLFCIHLKFRICLFDFSEQQLFIFITSWYHIKCTKSSQLLTGCSQWLHVKLCIWIYCHCWQWWFHCKTVKGQRRYAFKLRFSLKI